MIKVSIIGSGNVAFHLYKAMSQVNEVQIAQVTARNKTQLDPFVSPDLINTDFTQINQSDIYLICVSDSSIAVVSEFLSDHKGLVVHTSGATPMNVLNMHKRYGVFYPLQTFSKEREMNFENLPFCLEAAHSKDLKLLQELASKISRNILEISTEQRRTLHLCAILVNNFSNHLFHLAGNICSENQMNFSILQPLIKETIQKLDSMRPYDAQTGPARRGDHKTMQTHLNQLQTEQEKNIYKTLSDSIINTYGKEL